MKRKVNQLGNQSFSITLPIQWVKKNRLNKQSSEVHIHEFDKELKVEVDKRQLLESVTLSSANYPSHEILYKAIIEKYREGFKSITVQFEKNEKSIDTFYSRIEHFWGVDAIRVNNKIVINSTLKDQRVDEIIKKSFFIIMHIAETTDLNEIKEMNMRLHVINEYALRLLNTEISLPTKKLIKTSRATQSLVNLGECIERIKQNAPHINLSPYLKRLYDMKYKILTDNNLFTDIQRAVKSKTAKVKEDIHFLIGLFKELI